MARWLARGRREGWSRAELARRAGHPQWKLRWWQKRFARTRPGTTLRGPAIVAVEVTESLRRSGVIAITTPSGFRLEVASDVEAEHLRQVVAALEPRC